MNRDKNAGSVMGTLMWWANSCQLWIIIFPTHSKMHKLCFQVHQGLIGLKMYDLISCQFTTILLPCINANQRVIEWGRPGNKAETTAV